MCRTSSEQARCECCRNKDTGRGTSKAWCYMWVEFVSGCKHWDFVDPYTLSEE